MIARSSPAREVPRAGRARVRRELLAERNGLDTTSELLIFLGLYSRMKWGSCPQLTTDGWGPYVPAVAQTFGQDVDFAQLVKIYGSLPATREGYLPSRFVEAVSKVVTGRPDPMFVSTSYIERQNLALRRQA
jgi:hypothetical protein